MMIDSSLSFAFYSYILPPLAVATGLGAIRFMEIYLCSPVGAALSEVGMTYEAT